MTTTLQHIERLTAFLHARCDDDERIARKATVTGDEFGDWQWEGADTGGHLEPARWDDYASEPVMLVAASATSPVHPGSPALLYAAADDIDPGAAAHIVRHDPARVLADVAARRALIANTAGLAEIRSILLRRAIREYVAGMLAMQAAPFHAHRDYDPTWPELTV